MIAIADCKTPTLTLHTSAQDQYVRPICRMMIMIYYSSYDDSISINNNFMCIQNYRKILKQLYIYILLSFKLLLLLLLLPLM